MADSFARRHDFDRGYGPAMNRLLRRGGRWQDLAEDLFEGQGSWGNGAAMRVAPLGAWFAADLEEAAWQAARSAQVTHALCHRATARGPAHLRGPSSRLEHRAVLHHMVRTLFA